jgi:DNA repair protein RadC
MGKYSHYVSEISVSYKPSRVMTENLFIQSSADAYKVFKELFPEETINLQEQFSVLYLNRANKVIGSYRVSIGGLTGTVVDIRLILSVALKVAATGIVMSHNHPSGNLKPSGSDEIITRRLNEACKIMEIKLLDHIILSGNDGYFSFADEGHL